MYVKWACKNCGDVLISNSKRRHQMDTCSCGRAGLDLEEYYSRFIGLNYLFIKEYDYNFFDEIAICLIEQGFSDKIIMDGKIYLTFKEVYFIKELEDEILGGLI